MKENKIVNIDAWLIVQLVLVLILVILLLFSIGYDFLLPIASLVAGAALIVMGYNNYRIYKRKALTFVYVGFGILMLLTVFVGFING